MMTNEEILDNLTEFKLMVDSFDANECSCTFKKESLDICRFFRKIQRKIFFYVENGTMSERDGAYFHNKNCLHLFEFINKMGSE